MSDKDKNIHDPLIDTVESDDEHEEETDPTHRTVSQQAEQADPVHDMGSFNGDSLIVSGSPFKKSYSTTSLGEASVDSLVDEPLPIESVALSPFRIDSIHNSSLPSSQKDSHNFPVSVSDSLPPHVMELDSPERVDDQDENEFCVHKVTPAEEEDLFTGENISQQPISRRDPGQEDVDSLLISTRIPQKEQSWKNSEESTEKKDILPHSQDMFDSQSAEDKTESLGISTFEKEPQISNAERPSHTESRCEKVSGDDVLDQDIIPPSDQHEFAKEIVHPLGDEILKETVIQSSEIASPVKRKRENIEERSFEEKLYKKDKKEDKTCGTEDSDIEILDSEPPSANQSIEVVYDKKAFDSESMESQDLNLMLTGDTQVEMEKKHSVSDPCLKNENKSSQSQSLISMSDSDNLICKDPYSSFEESAPVESTIRSTQVELLCKPASPSSQPNVESLINSPILRSKEASEGSKSTNESSSSIRSVVVPTTSASHLDTQESVETHSPNRDCNTGVSYPYFDTPSQIAQESQEGVESVFIKAKKAAEKSKEEEKLEKLKQFDRITSENLKDSFDTPPLVIEEQKSQEETPQSLNGRPDIYSENYTPVCAINPTRSSQSTPISSQVTTESSTRWLFSKLSQENSNSNSDKEISQKSEVSAVDSDEEEMKEKNNSSDCKKLHQSSKRIGNLASTPNDSNNVSPHLTKEGSNIEKDSHLINLTVDSSESNSLNQNNLESSKADTVNIECESDSVHHIKDLIETGWVKFGVTSLNLECWRSPLTKEIVFSIEGKEEVIKESTPLSALISFTNPNLSKCNNSSSSSKDSRRISDISSISRVTTSSSGYLGDKSSSSNQTSSDIVRMESTRLSIASVTTISPPHPYPSHKFLESEPTKMDPQVFSFAHPTSVSSVVPKVCRVSVETQTDDDATSDESCVKYKYYRGRGRPRGRANRGARGIAERKPKPVTIPTPIKEDSENTTTGPVVENKGQQSKEDLENNFYSLLPPFLQEKLKNAQIPLTEDEEEIFILQKEQMNKEEQKAQFDEVLRKVRIAEIKPGSLVFARYIDKSYYSAIVYDWVKEDRWQVQYSLDDFVNVVREVYILPTDILPKGISCHVRHPKQKFSDPGVVKGHLFENGLLIHIIEIHKGAIVRAPHSHIILSAEVANLFMEPRISFNSMVASPGGDLSLDNIVPGKRRRETSSSPQKRIQSSMISSSRHRKPDSNLDSSDQEAGSKRKQTKSKDLNKPSAVPTAFSETSSSNADDSLPPQSSSDTPKSSKKRKASKISKTSKDPDSTKKTESLETPQSTPKTRSVRSTKSAKTKLEENISGKSSKKLFGSNEWKGKTVEKLPEPLMNPVVELIQLDDVSPSPSSSPKTSPKKKGRKPGSGSSKKNPKKVMKIEEENSTKEEVTRDVDPRLGPLPTPGCQLFKGYSILITHTGNPSHTVGEEDQSPPPLDKEHLKDQISQGGGYVIETFDEANRLHIQSLQSKKSVSEEEKRGLHDRSSLPSSKSPAKVLCISSSFCRTAKFIQCLIVGIPLVASEWIICSLKKNLCLNWLQFLLPAGMSLLTGNLMEQSINDETKDVFSTVGNVVDVVNGEKVFLASSSNPEFGELWLNLLTVAKAAVFKMPPKGGNLQRLIDRRTSVVVADSSIPEEELKRAKEVNVPVVSSEWFIQSLIARCKLQYDAHPEFYYAHKLNKISQVEEVEGNTNDN